MIKSEDRELLYEFIKLDMAIKSLQHDYEKLKQLKMSKVYIELVDGLLKNLRNDFYNKKSLLGMKSISLVKWVKIDEYFSDIIFKTAGEDEVLRYANLALKTHVENFIIERLKSHSF